MDDLEIFLCKRLASMTKALHIFVQSTCFYEKKSI